MNYLMVNDVKLIVKIRKVLNAKLDMNNYICI